MITDSPLFRDARDNARFSTSFSQKSRASIFHSRRAPDKDYGRVAHGVHRWRDVERIYARVLLIFRFPLANLLSASSRCIGGEAAFCGGTIFSCACISRQL